MLDGPDDPVLPGPGPTDLGGVLAGFCRPVVAKFDFFDPNLLITQTVATAEFAISLRCLPIMLQTCAS
jgi:hypothetical protein